MVLHSISYNYGCKKIVIVKIIIYIVERLRKDNIGIENDSKIGIDYWNLLSYMAFR